jgi:hypothetical protein
MQICNLQAADPSFRLAGLPPTLRLHLVIWTESTSLTLALALCRLQRHDLG